MRLGHVLTIWKKELQEALRDRRTLFTMVGLPILVYPLAMMGMSKLQESQQAEQKARSSKVAVWGEMPASLEARLKQAGDRFDIQPWAGIPADLRAKMDAAQIPAPPSLPMDLDDADPEKRPKPNLEDPVTKAAQGVILKRDADAVLVLFPGFAKALSENRSGAVSILFDSVRPESTKARDRLSDQLRLFREEVRAAREKDQKLAPGFVQALEIQSLNVAPEKRRAGMFLGMMFPYILIAFSVMSGFYAAIDVTAGEKERGTMQTLLCAPLESLEIIAGKFGAVWSITVLATVVNLLSLAATFSRIKLLPGMTMDLAPSTLATAFLLLLPITFMVSALFLAVGAFAKDFKEAQSYLTPMMLGLTMPLIITMTPGIELNRYLAFAPMINIALLIRQVFLGEWSGDLLFIVLLSSFCYASLALLFAARVFEMNNLLLGGKEGAQSIFDFTRRPGSRPSPAVALFLFAIVLVSLFYGSLAFEKMGIAPMLLISQYGFFLLPALGFALYRGFPMPETFSLRLPHWKGIAAAVLIGLAGWTVAAGLLIRLLPPPESLVKALEKILLMEKDSAPLWQALLLVALTPAICEEMFFRGMLMSGFRRMGRWPAILIAGFLFALAHSSIYRILPTLFLGVVFGYAVWKTRSIVAGVIAHALNNGLMVVIARDRELAKSIGLDGSVFLPWNVIAMGAAVFVLGVLLLRSLPEPEAQSSPTTA